MFKKCLRRSGEFILTLAVAGLFGCLLLRYAPGFDVDERELDQRYSSSTLTLIQNARSGEQNIVQFYGHYLLSAVHGDLGASRAYNRPVSELIAARLPITLKLISSGLLMAWTTGISLALVVTFYPRTPLILFSELSTGLFLCLPAAVLALIVFLSGGPVSLVIGAAIFPRVYRYARAVLNRALEAPHVLAASARGIPRSRILLRYVFPPAVPPLAAFLGVSITLAFGASIPVEVICDIPGLGQLAWKAALARDLPLLTAMTLLVTATTLTANAAADIAAS